MPRVLISIRPEFAEKILTGQKRFEFRRVWPAGEAFELVIYASAPAKTLVGSVRVSYVERGSRTAVWERTAVGAGITRSHFMRYTLGKMSVNALALTSATRFAAPIDPKTLFAEFRPPQSFRYFGADELAKLERARKRGAK